VDPGGHETARDLESARALLQTLTEMDPDSLTPREALEVLYTLKSRLS
jgi:DNA mismatch repair protein MutS